MNCPSSILSESIRILIPSLIVILGWVVVHKLSITREQDKSRREMVSKSADFLYEMTDTIHQLAEKYHTLPRDSKDEARIKTLLQDFNIRVTGLSKICNEALCLPTWRQVISFRRAIMGLHFEDEHLAPIELESNQLDLITETALSVKRELIELKHSQFLL